MAVDPALKKTKELVRKRARRRRRAWITLAAAAGLGLVLAAGYLFWLRDSSLVEVRDVEVRGMPAGTEQADEIQATIEDSVGGMTTLHLDPDRLDRDLAGFPRIESSAIEADFPNRATVTVRLRQDGSILGAGPDALLIAGDGTVLGPAGESAEKLPRIDGGGSDGSTASAEATPTDESTAPPEGSATSAGAVPSAGTAPPAGAMLEGPQLAQALVLGAAPSEIGSFLDRSDFGKDGVAVTLSNGLVLLFGDATSIEEKWRAAASVIADPELSGAGYVDLSVPRRPAVGSGYEPDGG